MTTARLPAFTVVRFREAMSQHLFDQQRPESHLGPLSKALFFQVKKYISKDRKVPI
jgi:hypothetical protein